MQYPVRPLHCSPDGTCDWNSDTWRDIPSLTINQFHARSSDYRPHVAAKIGYTTDALCLIFRVQDRYVRSVCLNYQESVCQDSCVELFVQPKSNHGYFNFEVNCGGTLLLYYIEDATPEAGQFKKYRKVPVEQARQIRIWTTMPKSTPIEIADPIEWRLEMLIPRTVMEPDIGPVELTPRQVWRANLYKCADSSSHPHWASWSPIGSNLSFHQPDRFGELVFE